METIEAVVESWRRNCNIIDNLVGRLTPEQLEFKQDPDGWPIAVHLAHMQNCRTEWLEQMSAPHAEGQSQLFTLEGETYIASRDIAAIRANLKQSGEAVANAMGDLLASGQNKSGPYDHPMMYLGHMVWHDGWHFGLITMALRVNGQELPEEWENEHVWGQWRFEEWA